MSHKHDQLLKALFHDPVSGNIHWREVESLLHHLGAKVEPAHGARFKVVLNGAEGFLHHPHHSSVLTRDHIKTVREFLTRAGIRGASD
ncbi:MAG: type II toxin-antitoxin system HicA family toxin [Burkholderiales bacterium]